MSTLLAMAQEQLMGAGYAVERVDYHDGPVLLFENDSILGFVLFYADVVTLLERWKPSSLGVLQNAKFALQRAERKAWNAYLVFLAESDGDYGQNIMLCAIEEDLVGTRKIARVGIKSAEDMRVALLPLLAMQNAPQLAAVDMPAEILLRTTELPKELVDAFLGGAAESALIQLLETMQ